MPDKRRNPQQAIARILTRGAPRQPGDVSAPSAMIGRPWFWYRTRDDRPQPAAKPHSAPQIVRPRQCLRCNLQPGRTRDTDTEISASLDIEEPVYSPRAPQKRRICRDRGAPDWIFAPKPPALYRAEVLHRRAILAGGSVQEAGDPAQRQTLEDTLRSFGTLLNRRIARSARSVPRPEQSRIWQTDRAAGKNSGPVCHHALSRTGSLGPPCSSGCLGSGVRIRLANAFENGFQRHDPTTPKPA
jgi:hypothetical protein